jgi:oligopeptide transport system permease protein
MEENLQKNGFSTVVKKTGGQIKKFVKNPTVKYVVKRVLSSCLTIVLLIAVIVCLIRLLPETSFYDVKQYDKIKGQIGGELGLIAAERFKAHSLFSYGLTDRDGNYHSIFYSIGTYLYNLLPFPKEIVTVWSTDYSTALETKIYFMYFGTSTKYAKPVLDLMTENNGYPNQTRIGISFTISIITTLLTYLISVPFGIAMAKKPGGLVDKIGNVFIVLNYAIPALVFYLIMNSVMGDPNGIFGEFKFGFLYKGEWQQLVPPIFCVVFLAIPGLAIWVRRFMIDELTSDYVKFARSKGLSESKIMYTHVLRNAMIPLVRNIPGTFLGAIVGSYYIETIWGIPGTGILLTTALSAADLDIPVVQGLTIIYAAISMISFLLGDLITVFFDPRIKITSN